MLRYRHLVAFYLLTFLLLGSIPAVAWMFNDGSMDFSAAAESASRATGVQWTSSLINVLWLSTAEPVLLLTMLGSAVPALAAIALLLYMRRRILWARFASRLLPWRGCGVDEASLTYVAIFVILVPCLLLVLWMRHGLDMHYESGVSFGIALIPSLLLMSLLDQGALLEELGWRGFAQPELQEIGPNPLSVAIIVGVGWGLWHLPRDVTTGVIERLGLVVYSLQFLPSFVLGTVAVSIIAIFFCNRLGGSVVPAILVHGIANDAIGISGSASIAEALTPVHQLTKNLPLALVAVGLILVSGTRLGLQDDRHGGG